MSDMKEPRARTGSRIEDDNLGCKFALGAIAGAHPHPLALAQLANARTAQRFHMDEDIRRAGAARNKAVALAAIEPFDRRLERLAGRLGDVTQRLGAGLRHNLR